MSLLVKSFRAVSRTPVARRCFSDVLHDRERAAEAAFFNQEDANKLAALQAKLRATAASRPQSGVVQDVIQTEIDQLRGIMAPHNLPEETLQAIVDWKHDLL